jgi:hypothetical protein
MLELAGVTDMEDRVAEVTVRVVLPEISPEVAVMVAVPAATAVARPLLLTVAADVFDELQVTCVVISRVVPSENVPVAANCWTTPAGMLGLAGVTATEMGPPVPPHVVRDIAKDSRATKDAIAKTNLIFFMHTPLRAPWTLWVKQKTAARPFFCLLDGNSGLWFALGQISSLPGVHSGINGSPPVWPAK